MLQLKDLREWIVGEKVTVWDGRMLKKLEGPSWRASMVRRHGGIVPPLRNPIIAYWYRMSMITCKWFGC